MSDVYRCGNCFGATSLSDSFCAECGSEFIQMSDVVAPAMGRTVMNNIAGQKRLVQVVAKMKKVKIGSKAYDAQVSPSKKFIKTVGNGEARDIPVASVESYSLNNSRGYVILSVKS